MEKTIENLCKAFIGESQARNRYSYYARTAEKEGLYQISDVFLLTAENEREHAKWILKLIKELNNKTTNPQLEISVEASVPVALDNTQKNLKSAIEGETYEYTEMYPEFADIADKEGLLEISTRLRSIAKAEKHHEERFSKLLKVLESNTLFNKDTSVSWVCRKCGYVYDSKKPPKKCPSCDHETEYFEQKCEKY